VVILPEGLYYGRVDPDAIETLLQLHDDRRLQLDKYRGRSTFSLGEQAAEYFVRREHGIDGIDAVTEVAFDAEHGAYVVDVAAHGDNVAQRLAV